MWGCMKKAVSKLCPKTSNELRAIVQQVWDEYPQKRIDSQVRSFFQRLQLVILEKGESIQTQIRKGLSLRYIVVNKYDNIIQISNIVAGLEHGIDYD